MELIAEIGFCWLVCSGLFTLGLTLWSEWKTPTRVTRCEIFGKEV